MLTRSVAPLRRAVLAGVGLSMAVVLCACSGNDDSSSMNRGSATSTPAASAGAGTTFNDADVIVAQMMIPHHRQAIEMAALAETRASNSEIRALAAKIQQAQQPEIDTMNQWLSAWGHPAPTRSLSGGTDMGMNMDDDTEVPMPGTMSTQDMRKLTAAKGTAFDKQFLTMMIAHHQGATVMAKQETVQGSNPEAKALAARIVADQQAEITSMQDLLKRL